MHGEPGERHRFVVRLPREAIVGDAFQKASGRLHLPIEVGEREVFDRHVGYVVKRPRRAARRSR
jgi:hypothetical protein